MKAIILAAGEGKRLRPYTDNVPKCMVQFKGKPIIDYILDACCGAGVSEIVVLNGYKREVLERHLDGQNIRFVYNPDYSSTNMVYTLFCAQNEFNDDIIISYADIVYRKEIITKLINSKDDFSVVVDKGWRKQWELRMDNPLEDAETMKIDETGKIVELGKKPISYEDIQGQYIGLIKISKVVLQNVVDFYHLLDRDLIYDKKDFNNMYMTSFIQLIIDRLMDVKPVFIDGGWLEIDSVSDLKIDVNL